LRIKPKDKKTIFFIIRPSRKAQVENSWIKMYFKEESDSTPLNMYIVENKEKTSESHTPIRLEQQRYKKKHNKKKNNINITP
jgi:hypothetical protein